MTRIATAATAACGCPPQSGERSRPGRRGTGAACAPGCRCESPSMRQAAPWRLRAGSQRRRIDADVDARDDVRDRSEVRDGGRSSLRLAAAAPTAVLAGRPDGRASARPRCSWFERAARPWRGGSVMHGRWVRKV